MAELYPDNIKSSSVSWTATQKIITIGYAVDALDSSEFEFLTDAIAATGVVTGDACPADSNCLATTFSARAIEGQSYNSAIVEVGYVGYDFYGSPTQDTDGNNLSYTYNMAVNQDQTNFAVDNPTSPLSVYWWADSSQIGSPNKANIKQGVTIPVLKPYEIKTVRWFYVSDGFPDDYINSLQDAVGYVNDAEWDGGDEKTWLVMGVTATSVGLPQQMMIEATFQYKPETWLAWAFSYDPNNGGIPNGSLKNKNDPTQTTPTTGSNGAAGFLPYDTESFSDLFGFS